MTSLCSPSSIRDHSTSIRSPPGRFLMVPLSTEMKADKKKIELEIKPKSLALHCEP